MDQENLSEDRGSAIPGVPCTHRAGIPAVSLGQDFRLLRNGDHCFFSALSCSEWEVLHLILPCSNTRLVSASMWEVRGDSSCCGGQVMRRSLICTGWRNVCHLESLDFGGRRRCVLCTRDIWWLEISPVEEAVLIFHRGRM